MARMELQKSVSAISESVSKYKDYLILKNRLAKEFLSEILCTYLLVCFGCGSIAQYTLAKKNSFNTYLSTNMSFSTAVTVGVLVGGKVSGAHMNPIVSFSMLLWRRLSSLQFFIYLIGQSIGAFLASVTVYVVYLDDLNWFDGGIRQTIGMNATAGIWGTYPLAELSTFHAIVDQLTGSGLLIIIILAISDRQNDDMPLALRAIMLGNAILLISLAYGMNCGYPVNPVRDFVPRLFTAIAGWGSSVFTAGNYYFWIPLIIPFFGASIAVMVYSLFISLHWPDADDLN